MLNILMRTLVLIKYKIRLFCKLNTVGRRLLNSEVQIMASTLFYHKSSKHPDKVQGEVPTGAGKNKHCCSCLSSFSSLTFTLFTSYLQLLTKCQCCLLSTTLISKSVFRAVMALLSSITNGGPAGIGTKKVLFRICLLLSVICFTSSVVTLEQLVNF